MSVGFLIVQNKRAIKKEEKNVHAHNVTKWGPEMEAVTICFHCMKKQPVHSAHLHILCSMQEKATRWWVNDDRFSIFCVNYPFKLIQFKLAFSNIQRFVEQMARVFHQTCLSLCCRPEWHCQKLMPKQERNVMSDGTNEIAPCVSACARASVCVDICGEIVRQMELSACPLCTVEPLKPHADICFIAAVSANAPFFPTQSHPPQTNRVKKRAEIETQREIYSHRSLSVKHAKTTTKEVRRWYE